ncbi:PIN domain-like protein [Kockovaella imperatae]|uniref:Exonuclease 1 n=1 Tax=Kockovaella imperatae TaxID=4999 RepID=A0A1Y1UCI2_9TREE|nr:PIN domain-like protein [Kockovaella imperatae]ORX35224.1 PIN domain-like protein [Kockovaella imperatae]
MGIQGLHIWIRQAQPQLLNVMKRRWADPGISGKRVAIDGTLLTNAFHLSPKNETPGLEGKGAIIGWYNLVKAMRSHGVKPVAVWDERGSRAWKAVEARKRLAARQSHLVRSHKEDDRASRLKSMQGLFEEFSSMTETERNIFHRHWADMLLQTLNVSLNQGKKKVVVVVEEEEDVPGDAVMMPPAGNDLPNKSPVDQVQTDYKTSSEPLTPSQAQESLDKVISFVDSFNEVLEEFTAHYRPYSRSSRGKKLRDKEDEMVIEHAATLETIAGESLSGGQVSEVGPRSGRRSTDPIDQTLRDLAPEVGETSAQTDLTRREGELLQTFLVTPPDYAPEKAFDILDTPTEGTIELLSETERQSRLNELTLDSERMQDMMKKRLAVPTAQDHAQCRELLIKMGVPILTAEIPYEAEGLASALAKANLVDFVGTEDSDVLAYEAPLLRGVSGGPITAVSGSELREAVDMTSSTFLDFCILLGTDASDRIPGVGPARAFKLIREHGSIENILASSNKYTTKMTAAAKKEFMRQVELARKVFTDLPAIPEGVVLEQGVCDEAALDRWLEDVHGLRFERGLGYVLEQVRPLPNAPHHESFMEDIVDEDEDDNDSISWDDILATESTASSVSSSSPPPVSS